ncbi:MAG: hypothetical protein Q8O95_01825 [bacterium]|nr:hypothetical protein [bacterium]
MEKTRIFSDDFVPADFSSLPVDGPTEALEDRYVLIFLVLAASYIPRFTTQSNADESKTQRLILTYVSTWTRRIRGKIHTLLEQKNEIPLQGDLKNLFVEMFPDILDLFLSENEKHYQYRAKSEDSDGQKSVYTINFETLSLLSESNGFKDDSRLVSLAETLIRKQTLSEVEIKKKENPAAEPQSE